MMRAGWWPTIRSAPTCSRGAGSAVWRATAATYSCSKAERCTRTGYTSTGGGGRWGPAITLSSPFDYHVWKSGTWAITAAPNAVIVAHVDDNSTVIDLWSSIDGAAFERTTVRLRNQHTDRRPHNSVTLQLVSTRHGDALVWTKYGPLYLAAADGFPAGALDRLPPNVNVYDIIADGQRWMLDGALYEPLRPGHPEYLEEDPLGENDRFRPTALCGDGAGGVVTAKVDAGQPPEPGVSDYYEARNLVPFKGGFLMVGATEQNTNQVSVPGVWLSQDGCLWRKDQVRVHGFQDADRFTDVATAGGVTVLIGVHEAEVVQPRIWAG